MNFHTCSCLSLLAENQTDALIDELMKTNAANKDPAKVLEEMERERKEMEEMFTIKAGEAEKLRESDVLSMLSFFLRQGVAIVLRAFANTLYSAHAMTCFYRFFFFVLLGAMQSVMEEEMKREMVRRQVEVTTTEKDFSSLHLLLCFFLFLSPRECRKLNSIVFTARTKGCHQLSTVTVRPKKSFPKYPIVS